MATGNTIKVRRGGRRGGWTRITIGAIPQPSTANPAGVSTPPVAANPTPVTPPTPQQIKKGNVLPKGGVPFSKFEKMTDDQKAQVIMDSLGVATPMFLDDSPAQRLAYFTGMSEKPDVVTESQLKKIQGQSLWRSVHNNYNRGADIGYTPQQIYGQIATGDFTMYSDSGGSAYGRAIYFDTHKGSYGSGQGYGIIHAKIKPTANIWTDNRVMQAARAEMQSGSKLGQALQAIQRADSSSLPTVYCLAKGIDGYRESGGYHMIVNRRALAVSDTLH